MYKDYIVMYGVILGSGIFSECNGRRFRFSSWGYIVYRGEGGLPKAGGPLIYLRIL